MSKQKLYVEIEYDVDHLKDHGFDVNRVGTFIEESLARTEFDLDVKWSDRLVPPGCLECGKPIKLSENYLCSDKECAIYSNGRADVCKSQYSPLNSDNIYVCQFPTGHGGHWHMAQIQDTESHMKVRWRNRN